MGRGVSAGGGQSSLGYLFGSGETTNTPAVAQNQRKGSNTEPSPKPAAEPLPKSAAEPSPKSAAEPSPKSAAASQPVENKQIPAGIPGNNVNNYFRADGQNCGNFLTDRPSTKVHAAPGGGSSLDYLFGGGGK